MNPIEDATTIDTTALRALLAPDDKSPQEMFEERVAAIEEHGYLFVPIPKGEGNFGELRPLNDRVIVIEAKPPTRSAGGVLLDSEHYFGEGSSLKAVEVPRGTVAAVGRKVEELEPGDHVCWTELGGVEIKLHGERYLVFLEREILAVLEPTE